MIAFPNDDHWVCIGNGPTRSIVAEGVDRQGAVRAYGIIYQQQLAAEQAAFNEANSLINLVTRKET
jgi:hypothetical protein